MTRSSDTEFEAMRPAERQALMDAVRSGASRRDVLGFLGLAGMAAGAAGGVFTGAARAADATPKRGGTIRVASISSSSADTLDPAKQAISTDYIRCNFFYNKLVLIDSAGAPQPELAESFSSDKATVWTFKLRSGVTFHDGRSLSADDVVFSLKRHLDPDVGSKARVLAQQMTEIVATGPRELRITLGSPNADWPVILGTHHFAIVPKDTTDFTKGIGTGPFKCQEFSPGVRTVAVRNPSYWRGPGPFLDRIELFGIADESARMNALMSGDVELISTLNPRTVRILGNAGHFGILETNAGLYTDLISRLDMAPGGNPGFTQGLKTLMNREQVRTAVHRGYATTANDQPVPPTNRYYAADLPKPVYDPEKAKYHFAKAGVLGSKIPVVASPAADNSVEIAVLLQQEASKIGLDLDVQRVPSDGYWSNYWMKSPLGFGNVNPRPTADLLLTLFFKSDAPWNESRWKNPHFDQLIGAARAETDETKRRQMYHDAQALVQEGAGVVIPSFISNLDAYTGRLKGLKPMPTGSLMGYAFGEYVWLDA